MLQKKSGQDQDYRAIYHEMIDGQLSWLFDTENEQIGLRVSQEYREWLKANSLLDKITSDEADEYYSGVFFSQRIAQIQSMRQQATPTVGVTDKPHAKSVASAKSVVFDKIKIDVKHEYFETEQGQWMLWFIFFALTILDWVTNVWALSQRLDMSVGLESATVWHWVLGGVLVFSEIYLGLVRTLWRRTPKDRAQEVVILIVLWVIVLLAIGYDFVATLIPPYNAIGGVGGIITGLLLAGITTVGSSYFLQQSQIVWQLFKQRMPKK